MNKFANGILAVSFLAPGALGLAFTDVSGYSLAYGRLNAVAVLEAPGPNGQTVEMPNGFLQIGSNDLIGLFFAR